MTKKNGGLAFCNGAAAAFHHLSLPIPLRSQFSGHVLLRDGSVELCKIIPAHESYGEGYAFVIVDEIVKERANITIGRALLVHKEDAGNDKRSAGGLCHHKTFDIYKVTDVQVCVKVISGEAASEVAEGEVERMLLVSTGPSRGKIVELIDFSQDTDGTVFIVMEYLGGNDLFYKMQQRGSGLPEDMARSYFQQILEGVKELKDCGIAHMDLSTENIMFDEAGRCKIIDLGLSQIVKQSSDGTLCYVSPRGKGEYLSPEVYYQWLLNPYQVDMWNCGILLYILLAGIPFYTTPTDRAFKMLAMGKASELITWFERYGYRVPDGAKELMISLLQPDGEARPTVEQVLQHPWLKESFNTQGQAIQPPCEKGECSVEAKEACHSPATSNGSSCALQAAGAQPQASGDNLDAFISRLTKINVGYVQQPP